MAEETREEISTLPPPVEIPEYFPGFTQQFEALGAEFKGAYYRLQEAQKKVDQPIVTHISPLPDWMSKGSLYSWLMEPLLTKHLTEEQIQQLKAPAIAELEAAVQAVQSLEWKAEMMNVLPLYLSDPQYDIKNAQDVLQYINPGYELTGEDTAWLNQLYSGMEYLNNVLPEDYSGDVLETQAKLLEEILARPKVEMRGIHHLTVEEIAKAFAYGVPELPEGLSEQQVRSLLARMDLTDEELKERREWLADRAHEWEVESARMNLIRAGVVFAGKPELTPWEWTKMIATQPMLATVELMQKWWDTISRPMSAAIIMNLPAPLAGLAHGVPLGGVTGGIIAGTIAGAFGGPIGMAGGAIIGGIVGAISGTVIFSIHADEWDEELTKHYDFYRDMGESSWASYAQAFNDWDAPWWQKAILDSAYDPLYWIGWGGATAAGTKLKSIGYAVGTGYKHGIKGGVARAGALISAFEQGFMAGSDAIFKAGKQIIAAPIKSAFWVTGAGYTIPKTFTQMSRNFGRQAMMDLLSVTQKRFPGAHLVRGKLMGITTDNFMDVLTECTRHAIKNPTAGDQMARAGTAIMEFTYRNADDAVKLMKGLGVDDALWDTVSLARLNSDLLDALSGFVEMSGVVVKGDRVAAANILNRLNKLAGLSSDDATKLVNDLASRIGKFKENLAKEIVESVKNKAPGDAIYSIFERLVKSRYDNLHSDLTKHMQQAGRSASWHSRVADKILYSSRMVAMERRLVMPVAKQQLLFTNFGPYNYLENSMRSFLGGAEFSVPKAYGGVDETLEVIGKLSGCPYEMIMMQRGEKRLVQAIVNPETGKALVFKGGKIPFVTRNVSIPEKIPALGGKQLGMTLTIGNKKYFLGSAQDWYDMWSDLVGKQLAYDYQVHFTKALYETPLGKETIDSINEALIRGRPILDDIPSIRSYRSDIERLLRWKGLNSPDAIRNMADVDVLDFNRRWIGQQFNQVADQMNDIHRITKEGLYDSVLDGSMFSRGYDSIDDTFAARLASERDLQISSLAPQIEAMKDQVDWLVNNPAKNMDDFLHDMNTVTGDIEAVRATIHDYRRLTELRKGQMLLGEADNFEVGSARMLAEYLEQSEEQLVKAMNQLMENAKALNRGLAIDWSQVTFDEKLLDLGLDKNVKKMVEDLPIDVQFGIRNIEINPKIPGSAAYNPSTKTISFKSVKQVTDVNMYHEISHNYIHQLYDSDRLDDAVFLLLDYYKANPGAKNFVSADRIQELPSIIHYRDSYNKFSSLHESFAEHFQAWLREPNLQAKWAQNFFEANFPRKVDKALSAVQLARLTDLNSISQLELQNILAARTKLSTIEAEIPAFHKRVKNLWKTNPDKAASESKLFWDSQRYRKTSIWSEFDETADKLKFGRLEASRNFLTSVDKPVFIPEYVPEVVGDLTANHLAYLHGVTGDDLYRGLTRIQHHTTTTPRKDFIINTREQASAYATKFGKTADQLGFTEEAIGEVYDQMWRSLGVNPNILTPDSPTALQLEELRQEMHRWYSSTKIPESDVIKWRGYLNQVADDIGELGVYKAAPAVAAPAIVGAELRPITTDVGQGFEILHQGKVVGEISYGTTEALGRKGMMIGEIEVAETARRKGFASQAIDRVLSESESLGVPLYSGLLEPDGVKLFNALKKRGLIELTSADEKMFGEVITRGSKPFPAKAAVAAPAAPTVRPAVSGTSDWWATKETAVSKAREMHKLAYPTYDEANIIDETMRAIFPFWNYELFRWQWLPRTFMRTPGVMSGLARYMHYTDQGYTPVPGTDLQLNPLRGTVFMGGLRSFYLRDFPEYHDTAPGIEFLDYIGRAGFFPGIHVMLPIVLFGDPERVGGVPQWGQLAPAWAKTSLSALRTLSPEHIGKVLEIVYPDRFRDYMVMMTLASWGYDGDEIWKKKKQNIALTEEEEKLWLRAVNEVDGLKGVLMNQTGLFRIRPEEFTEIRKEMMLAIEEATGVPVSIQDWISKTYPVTGKRFTDYFHLDVQQQALIYQWESYRRYQGIITPLYPSSWQALDIRISDYYQELDKVFTEARYHGRYDEEGNLLKPSMVDINRQLVEGTISPDSWRAQRSSMQQGLAEAAYILGQSPLYKDVPKTFEERVELLKTKGIPTPTQTPDQELLYYYYELQPEYKYDWEMDRMELDFDTYYAMIDALLESLSPAHRERLLERIHNDWTPMEILYWEFSREYARPYRNLRDIVLKSYTPEQQQIIRRFEVARGEERTELQQVMGPDGKLISSFQRKLREARLSLRMLDPELDAWLNFFGTTDKLVSARSKEIYAGLREQYLTEAMIGYAKQ